MGSEHRGQGSRGDEFGSPSVHSPAYLHWKRLGAQQGLREDRDIACFLLKYYKDTSRVLPAGLTGVCKTCGTPLSISCTGCDWIISADATSTSPHHKTSANDSTGEGGEGRVNEVREEEDPQCPQVSLKLQTKERGTAEGASNDGIMQTGQEEHAGDDQHVPGQDVSDDNADHCLESSGEPHHGDLTWDSCHGLPAGVKQESNCAQSSGAVLHDVTPDVSLSGHQRNHHKGLSLALEAGRQTDDNRDDDDDDDNSGFGDSGEGDKIPSMFLDVAEGPEGDVWTCDLVMRGVEQASASDVAGSSLVDVETEGAGACNMQTCGMGEGEAETSAMDDADLSPSFHPHQVGEGGEGDPACMVGSSAQMFWIM
ncbi:hypothetical protein ACOMHN_012316 [Nucella lapillus]